MYKSFIVIGCFLIAVGVLGFYFKNLMTWVGHLPGDIKVQKENFTFYFPITTMLLLSIIVNVLVRLYKYISNI